MLRKIWDSSPKPANIIITMVNALHIFSGWEFSFFCFFSFFDRDYFNLVVILFLCYIRKVAKTTHIYKNSSIIVLGISLTGLFWVTVSVLIDVITLFFKIILPVPGIIICILQMEKLRLCLCCKVGYIINGIIQIILTHRFWSWNICATEAENI